MSWEESDRPSVKRSLKPLVKCNEKSARNRLPTWQPPPENEARADRFPVVADSLVMWRSNVGYSRQSKPPQRLLASLLGKWGVRYFALNWGDSRYKGGNPGFFGERMLARLISLSPIDLVGLKLIFELWADRRRQSSVCLFVVSGH